MEFNIGRFCEIGQFFKAQIGFTGDKLAIGNINLNPETPTSSLKPWLDEIDVVMFMGVYPGHGGQDLISDAVTKIRLLRYSHSGIKIEIDGGVKVDNILQLKEAGADIFAIGSGILAMPDVGQAIADFKNVLSK